MNRIIEQIDHVGQNQEAGVHHLPMVLGYQAVVNAINTDADSGLSYGLTIANNHYIAKATEGLLVSPEMGDTVLCIKVEDSFYVSQVIKRKVDKPYLLIESMRPIEWVAPVLRFKAFNDIELTSAKKVTISACDFVCGATRSLIQQAHNILQQAGSYSLTAKGLMRTHAKQQVITAEEDMRMDAKRINMG